MMPIQDRNVVIDADLPVDPENGTVYDIPDGKTAGSVNIIYVYHKNKQIGNGQQLSAVPNVSKKYALLKVHTNYALKPHDIIRVKAAQYMFTSLKFIDYFGWSGHEYSPAPIILHDRNYRVLDIVKVPGDNDRCNLYEQLCLEMITGE